MKTDSFHRLAKVLADSGEAPTLQDALNTFGGYGVRVVLDARVSGSLTLQIIALTVINIAARSFQGNVHISGDIDMPLVVYGFEDQRLSQFAAWAGVSGACTPKSTWPEIRIGDVGTSPERHKLVPWASGWLFGIGVPQIHEVETFAPACVAAGALAVSEAFSLLRGDNPYAGRRAVSFSLWSMKEDAAQAPLGRMASLDDGLWLVGLGHLGQAYCWTLGLMNRRKTLPLILQDIDVVTPSTLSTSVLSCSGDVGAKKTRVAAAWMERRGFDTRLTERIFDSATHVAPSEPTTALLGLDNAAGRRCSEGAGFGLILDAGLGSGYRDFRTLRVRVFPGASSAKQLWATDALSSATPLAPAYQALLADGMEPCGITTLATRSVGAPFVGCYAAAVLIAELIRRRMGGPGYNVIDVSLRTPGRTAVA